MDCKSEKCPNCNKPINPDTNLEKHVSCHNVDRYRRQLDCSRCRHRQRERMMPFHEEEEGMDHRGCKVLVREGYDQNKENMAVVKHSIENFQQNALINFQNLLVAFQDLERNRPNNGPNPE